MNQNDNIVYLEEFKWDKKCGVCKNKIRGKTDNAPGESGWWAKNNTPAIYYHKNCFKKNAISSNANPKGVTHVQGGFNQDSNSQEPSYGASEEAEAKVDSNLTKAIIMVKAQIPNAEEYQDYLAMVTEVLHQLGSSEWLDIEKKKLKK